MGIVWGWRLGKRRKQSKENKMEEGAILAECDTRWRVARSEETGNWTTEGFGVRVCAIGRETKGRRKLEGN